MTSFFSVAGRLCFGSFSFCVLGARPFVLPLLLLSLVFVFSVSLVGCVWLASLGFFFCWGLFCGVCFLLGVWLMLSFVGCWCVGFIVFRAFSFGLLLHFPCFYHFSPSALLLRGSATWAFGLLLPFACSCMFPPSGVLAFSSLLTFGFALPCLLGGSTYL